MSARSRRHGTASKQESPMRAMAEQDEAEDEIEVEVEVTTAAVSGAW